MRHFTRTSLGSWTTAIVLTIALASFGTPLSRAGAAPTTTTQPVNYLVAGNQYARHLLRLQPIPPNAHKVATLPTPIRPNGVGSSGDPTSHAWGLYLVPRSVSVQQFVRGHLPNGETVSGSGSGEGPQEAPLETLELSATCESPHITYCGVTYTTTVATNGDQELRVDADVTYLPIIDEQMPTNGSVTVTGYGKLSLVNSSTEPTSVVLTHTQVLSLHTAVAQLKDFNGGMCMEDSLLLKIKIVRHGEVVWSASADECPGALSVARPHSTTTLDDRSCAFWHVVDSFFKKGTARGTIAGSKVCSSPN